MTNLAENLAATVAEHGDRIALKLDDIELNYAVLDQASARAAGLLAAAGIGPGDRVGVMLPNVPYFPFVFYGAMRMGAVVVPLNPLLKEREVAFHLSDSGAKVLLAWHQFEEAAQAGADDAGAEAIIVKPGDFEERLGAAEPLTDTVERDDDDTAVILYTSGTTGKAKGAELTHFNMFFNAVNAGTMLFPSIPGVTTVSLATLPLFHSFGQTVVHNMTLFHGGTIVLLPRFEPKAALDLMQKHRVTFFAGVPTMYFALLHYPEADRYDLSTLHYCVSGGAPMPAEVMKAFDAQYKVNVLEGYGLSETSPVASFNTIDRPKKIASIGRPIWGVDFKLVDDHDDEITESGKAGEICIRGQNVMKGYFKRPEATAEAMKGGWFHTGDVATRDDDGYYFIVDRKKDMILRGGFNVYPREIEEVLYGHPAVAEAAVIGVPHASHGEEVKAIVALKPGQEATDKDIISYCRERLAAFKYPRIVEFRDALPKGPTGKILKRELRETSVAR